MREVYDGLHVGDELLCSPQGNGTATVHACKHPCHQRAVGYSGSLSRDHPDYLTCREGKHLYLNFVDMDRKQSHEFMQPILTAAMDFIEEHLPSGRVEVHCNQGRSRSPTIAMLYLAKRTEGIPSDSYQSARASFQDRYPDYDPGRGIHLYLEDRWVDLE